MRNPVAQSPRRPVLSAITPVYNVADYIHRCIESVLSQTLSDLELLVVDDGSTDETPRIVQDYAARDLRVRMFRGPNRGVSHARNVAMRHARGRYLAFLDGDDEWDPRFAMTLVGALERQPEMAIATGNAVNDGGGALDGRLVRPWPEEPREITFLDMIEREDAVFIMSVFRREVFDAIGGFNESLCRSEDYEFWLRAAATGFRVLAYPQPLGRYRRRSGSASADQTAMIDAMMTVLARARGFRGRARADELAAIDRQIARLSSMRLLCAGKAALLRRDFAGARTAFLELYREDNRVQHALLWASLLLAPRLVLKAYEARLARLERTASRENRLSFASN